MTLSAMGFESRDTILLVTSWTETMWSQTLFQNIYILRRPGVTNIADTIKIAIKLTRAAFKTQQIRKNVLKCNF